MIYLNQSRGFTHQVQTTNFLSLASTSHLNRWLITQLIAYPLSLLEA